MPDAPCETQPQAEDKVFIRTEHHPRCHIPDSLLSLDRLSAATTIPELLQSDETSATWHEPWAPFPSRADFELAEEFTSQRMNNDHISTFLKGMGSSSGAPPTDEHRPGYQPAFVWHLGLSLVTMKLASDYHKLMEKARSRLLKVIVSITRQHRLIWISGRKARSWFIGRPASMKRFLFTGENPWISSEIL